MIQINRMVRSQWKSRLSIIFIIVCVYFLLRIKNYDYKANVFVPNVHPNKVWEFVADFSNMKQLNPTITDFNIIDEKGNYDHWQYSVEYSERLSHWPYLPNHALAHFNIIAGPQKDVYYVNSVHTTCLFFGYFCLESASKFMFSHHNNSSPSTLCEESIVYQCPAFLSTFCRREVIFQRDAIMNNLKKHFSIKKTLI